MKRSPVYLVAVLMLSGLSLSAQVYYAGKAPAAAIIQPATGTLENSVLKLKITTSKDHVQQAVFTDKQTGKSFSFPQGNLFELKLKDGSVLTASDFQVSAKHTGNIMPSPGGVRLVDAFPGKQLAFTLVNAAKHIRITWQFTLRNDCNFVQQHFHITDPNAAITDLLLVNVPSAYQPALSGTVDGSPVLAGNSFFALEHPMAQGQVTTQGAGSSVAASATLRSGKGFDVGTAWGVTPETQLRRGFLYYLEKVRAVPYRPFPHYNSWYDVGYDGKEITEANAMDRIRVFGDSLVLKRKARISAFLWDSGWDDYNKLWHFSKHLPNGFKKMEALATKYHSAMGVWVSPWGGYDQEKISRLASIKTLHLPFTPNDNGLSLADKSYFDYFKQLTTGFVKDQGVVSFKFDGIGAGNGASGAGEKYARDVEAFLRVITDLRKMKPGLFFNLTVGTWPSPYWLNYGDAIWRAGGDMGLQGTGTKRQQWITYRDAEVYKNVVQRAKLYPLNALMYHGIVVNNENGVGAGFTNDDAGIAEDIWEFFGNGTGMQELYINPHLMSSNSWNVLAKAMRWSDQHRHILPDVHWVGGDPGKQEIYGFAAWNHQEGILTWRNPSPEIKKITFRLKDVLELPAGYQVKFSVYNVAGEVKEKEMDSEAEVMFELAPFQVKVLELKPVK
ncbi:hypothetical protein [Chitinophaga sp.]|uniref:hypothetical protein n=1 Tax=Chitinophaga sp. TaxID=1869181 RepID=UPI002F956BFA